MGVVAGYVIILTPLVALVILALKVFGPTREYQRKASAGRSLAVQVNAVLRNYNGSLDFMGDTMREELINTVNDYYKEIDK